jgi:hypothetical protein
MPTTNETELLLAGWGTARADLASIAAMRKSIPPWAPEGTAGHFLKHADEQTVLAVAAVDQAIRSRDETAASYSDWAIIAAPRFIGRLAGTATLDRFSRGGGSAISPHLIPQHSLHSPSGALSILLASRQPNFGVGGSCDSLREGLLAALTFPVGDCQGVWLIATSWDPEPQIDENGSCTNQPVCYAAALAFQTAAANSTCGSLRLRTGSYPQVQTSETSNPHAADLCRALMSLVAGGQATSLCWNLPWGGALVLEASERAKAHSLAA